MTSNKGFHLVLKTTNCKTLIPPAVIGYFDKKLHSSWSCMKKD